MVIGDNLSSHINQRVLLECEKHNIGFICLPPNATHILQPLDVAYFRPLKCKWRQVLLDWKNSQSGRALPTTPKDQFPCLLKKALESLTETKGNLIAGFRKSGIVPIDKEEPLSRLPKQDRIVDVGLIGDSFMQKLIQSRANICPEKKIAKKKKLNVAPGRSICAADLAEAGPSGQQQLKKAKKEVKIKRCKRIRSDSSTSCSDSAMSLASSTEDHVVSWNDEDEIPINNFTKPTKRFAEERNSPVPHDEANSQILHTEKSPTSPVTSKEMVAQSEAKVDPDSPSILLEKGPNAIVIEEPSDLQNDANIQDPSVEILAKGPNAAILIEETSDMQNAANIQDPSVEILAKNMFKGDYVLVEWNKKKYPGQLTSIATEEGAVVSCMKRGKEFWRWPVCKDEQLYSWQYIICKINIPKFEKKRLFLGTRIR